MQFQDWNCIQGPKMVKKNGEIKALQGDLEFVRDGSGLESSNSGNPCPICRCNSGNVPWSDHRPEALWRTRMWDDKRAWEEAHPQRAGVFSLPGLWVHHVFLDVMHTKHLGTDSYVAGSFFAYLVDYKRPPDVSEVRWMAAIWADIKAAYQDLCKILFLGYMVGLECGFCHSIPTFLGGCSKPC